MISYHFSETEKIKQHLLSIEAIKVVFDQAQVLPQVEENIRRQSILKSSLYSARIEGNPLTSKDLSNLDSNEIHKLEIANLTRAYDFVYTSSLPKTLTLNLVRDFHTRVMKNISLAAGKFRQEPWAVYDQFGNVIHLAPPHFDVPNLMAEYVDYINSLNYHPCVNSAISQFIFEKIHPFADGNGRAGRLVSAYLLRQSDYSLRGMLPFEEYTDTHRQQYYYALEPSRDMTEFVEYFLSSLIFAAKDILPKINSSLSLPGQTKVNSSNLSPRRQEILNIITDHPHCSFDFLARRFAAINPKTLHYDLKKLLDLKLILKLGTTKGVVYKTT